MAKEPKAVFLLSDGGFTEIPYTEFTAKYRPDEEYMKNHFFIRFGDYIMEVKYKDYKEYYKNRRRQKYLYELAAENSDVSFDALSTAEFNGEDVLTDNTESVADQVSRKIMLDRLCTVMDELSPDERKLIDLHYFKNVSQTDISEIIGINQSNVSRRLTKILIKLKRLLAS